MPRVNKSITAQMLDRFEREERGQGVHADYVAWRRVRRAEPPSKGRSHLVKWRGRQLDLLSDQQLCGMYYAVQLPGLADLREQFPLQLYTADHELAAYDPQMGQRRCRGTLEIASSLHARHPLVPAEDGNRPKPLVTSQLLTLQDANGHYSMLAVTYRRSRPKINSALAVEAAYWADREITWLLVTEQQVNKEVSLCLRRTACWAMAEPMPAQARQIAVSVVMRSRSNSLTTVLYEIAKELDGLESANRALWQAAWFGELPLDMRRGWRPHLPLMLLAPSAWLQFNPLACRSSAWL